MNTLIRHYQQVILPVHLLCITWLYRLQHYQSHLLAIIPNYFIFSMNSTLVCYSQQSFTPKVQVWPGFIWHYAHFKPGLGSQLNSIDLHCESNVTQRGRKVWRQQFYSRKEWPESEFCASMTSSIYVALQSDPTRTRVNISSLEENIRDKEQFSEQLSECPWTQHRRQF